MGNGRRQPVKFSLPDPARAGYFFVRAAAPGANQYNCSGCSLQPLRCCGPASAEKKILFFFLSLLTVFAMIATYISTEGGQTPLLKRNKY